MALRYVSVLVVAWSCRTKREFPVSRENAPTAGLRWWANRHASDTPSRKTPTSNAGLILAAEAVLRHLARVRAVHTYTFIEGNRLTLDEAERVIDDENAEIPGLKNIWSPLQQRLEVCQSLT